MPKVAIAGAGNVAFTGACLLNHLGNEPVLWSPSGRGTLGIEDTGRITTSGTLNGTFRAAAVKSPRDLAEAADLIMVAIPAFGQKSVFEQLLPHLTDDHSILVTGGQLGYGVLYLDRLLAEKGLKTQVGLIHGPITMGRKLGPNDCVQVPAKTAAFTSAVNPDDTGALIARWETAWGPRFRKGENLLGVGMRLMGGIVHPALTICNITRIELAEDWCGYGTVTESVSNLIEALDADRLTVCRAYGLDLPDVVQMFGKGDPRKKTAQDTLQPLTYERTFRNGPKNIKTRYIEEEVPYHLVTIEQMARKAGLATPLLSSLVDVYNATRRKDYRIQNTMAEALGIEAMTQEELLALWSRGYRAPRSPA